MNINDKELLGLWLQICNIRNDLLIALKKSTNPNQESYYRLQGLQDAVTKEVKRLEETLKGEDE